MSSYRIKELNCAIEQLDNLRKSLDYIRATTARSELAATVRDFQGKACALREELEDSVAAYSGDLLTLIAEEMEAAELARGESGQDIVLTLSELRRTDGDNEPLALDRDLRVLHKTWKESCFPEEMQSRLAEAKLASSFGIQAATVLTKYFDEIKERSE